MCDRRSFELGSGLRGNTIAGPWRDSKPTPVFVVKPVFHHSATLMGLCLCNHHPI